jgi:hypothetical protein
MSADADNTEVYGLDDEKAVKGVEESGAVEERGVSAAEERELAARSGRLVLVELCAR